MDKKTKAFEGLLYALKAATLLADYCSGVTITNEHLDNSFGIARQKDSAGRNAPVRGVDAQHALEAELVRRASIAETAKTEPSPGNAGRTSKRRPGKQGGTVRRGKHDVHGLELQLVELLRNREGGVSASDVRNTLGLESSSFLALIRRLKQQNLVTVTGEKRGTRYFAATQVPAAEQLTKVVRRRASMPTKLATTGIVAA